MWASRSQACMFCAGAPAWSSATCVWWKHLLQEGRQGRRICRFSRSCVSAPGEEVCLSPGLDLSCPSHCFLFCLSLLDSRAIGSWDFLPVEVVGRCYKVVVSFPTPCWQTKWAERSASLSGGFSPALESWQALPCALPSLWHLSLGGKSSRAVPGRAGAQPGIPCPDGPCEESPESTVLEAWPRCTRQSSKRKKSLG